jgi:hypothetical protein
MATVKFQYPGDPVLTVELLTGAQFLAKTPQPREIVMRSAGQPEIRLPIEDVLCDQCNSEIQPADFCALAMQHLYCRECYERWIKPYLLQ